MDFSLIERVGIATIAEVSNCLKDLVSSVCDQIKLDEKARQIERLERSIKDAQENCEVQKNLKHKLSSNIQHDKNKGCNDKRMINTACVEHKVMNSRNCSKINDNESVQSSHEDIEGTLRCSSDNDSCKRQRMMEGVESDIMGLFSVIRKSDALKEENVQTKQIGGVQKEQGISKMQPQSCDPAIILMKDEESDEGCDDDDDDDDDDDVQIKTEGNQTDIKSEEQCSGTCEVCKSCQAKYTCPQCELRSCSLTCVRQHKTQSGCSGERSKCAFIDISEYTDRHLLNDYRFLEDAERKMFCNMTLSTTRRQNSKYMPYRIPPKRCKLLMDAAYKRGVTLRFISPALTKSKCNRSFYTISSDTIDWHIDWLFSATNTLVKDEKVRETTNLVDAARKFVNFIEHPHLKKSLEDYREDKLESSRYLLKVECLPANRIRYLELKPTSTLAENLKGVCLIEYPTIVVLSPAEKKTRRKYIRLSKDDMSHMELAAARHMIQHRPELNPAMGLQQQLLNPSSCLYDTSQDGNTRVYQKQPDVVEIEDSDEDSDADDDDSDEEDETKTVDRAEKIKALLENFKSFTSKWK